MPTSILLIEDDADFASLVKLSLEEEHYEVRWAADGLRGLEQAKASRFDLILLDLMMPELDGLEVCRRLRAAGDTTPLLMLTARDAELDRVLGLELGADDYMPKTMGMRELIARVRAALRRRSYAEQQEADSDDQILDRGRLRIDTQRREVTVDGAATELTAKEFDLLVQFAAHPGRVYTREDLLSAVWGYDYEGYQHTVNSHINRLRAKIEPDPRKPSFLQTVWGVGYRFLESGDTES